MLTCYVCVFSLRRESPDMILGDKPLLFQRTATSEKAADLATAASGALPAVVSEIPATVFGCFVPTRLVSLSFAAAVLVGLTVGLSFARLFSARKSDPRRRICRW
jgi:hypothetical protein